MQPNACTIRKLKEDMTKPQPGEIEEGLGRGPGKHQEVLNVAQTGRQEQKEWSHSGSQRYRETFGDLSNIIKPTLQIGGLCGVSGVVFGSFGGVLWSRHPALFALASGIQWFTLSSTFYASRSAILYSWNTATPTPRDKISASTLAGAISGFGGGLIRGPRNVIPGTIMFSVFGAAGQALYNELDAENTKSVILAEQKKGVEDSWWNSKWSPMKKLSDDEYEHMLRERLLRINADIALLDEQVDTLKEMEKFEVSRHTGTNNSDYK